MTTSRERNACRVQHNASAMTKAQNVSCAVPVRVPAHLSGAIPIGLVRLRSSMLTASSLIAATRERSEEHTSELQSHSDLVCRLLLEKKKTQNWWRPDQPRP